MNNSPEQIAAWLNDRPGTHYEKRLRNRFRVGAKTLAVAYKILREKYGRYLICDCREGIGAFDDKPMPIIKRTIY